MILKPGFLFALVWLLLTGCSHYTINKEGYIRPVENYKFSYKNKVRQLVDTAIIDTTCIYLLQNSNYYRHTDQYKNGDNYIRFYADGRFKEQGIKEGLKLEDVNDINKGIVGYYQLRGRVVKLQLYTDINAGSDQLKFGMIDEGRNLVVLNENPRTNFCLGYSEKGITKKLSKSYFNPKVYKKIKLEGLTYARPDW